MTEHVRHPCFSLECDTIMPKVRFTTGKYLLFLLYFIKASINI